MSSEQQARGMLDQVTNELLAHGEFSSSGNSVPNARIAAQAVIDIVIAALPASQAGQPVAWREALEAALPHLDNSESPGGCNGKHKGCAHCAAIAKVKAALAAPQSVGVHPVAFLCPCCGAHGTTDGKASTVTSGAQPSARERPHSIYGQYYLDNWTDEDFAKHSATTRKTVAWLLELEAALANGQPTSGVRE